MKEVTIKITCDSCNSDISPRISGYQDEYIIKVEAIDISEHIEGQGIYLALCHKPIKHDLYFCGLNCMKKYGEE